MYTCAGFFRDQKRVFDLQALELHTLVDSLVRAHGTGVQSLARTISVLNLSHFSSFKIDQMFKREQRGR